MKRFRTLTVVGLISAWPLLAPGAVTAQEPPKVQIPEAGRAPAHDPPGRVRPPWPTTTRATPSSVMAWSRTSSGGEPWVLLNVGITLQEGQKDYHAEARSTSR